MLRARLKTLQRVLVAAVLLGLIVCGAEVGVRVYEAVQGTSVCAAPDQGCITDPAGLSVPSWTTDRELKPLATAEVKCRDGRRIVEVRTNSFGLRGPEVAVPKPPDTFRIVMLGDETILAPETPEEEHGIHLLTQFLQQRTNLHIEILNAGIPGACPLTEELQFKHKLLALQPDLVVAHFDWSDVFDDQQLRRRTRSDAHGHPLACPHASLIATPSTPKALDKLRRDSRLVDWTLTATGQKWKQQIHEQAAASRESGANAYAWLRDEHPEENVAVVQSFQPLAHLARLASSSSFQFVVVTSPKPWQVSARCSNGAETRLKSGVADDACFPNRAPFDALAAFSNRLQIPYADASYALATGPEPETNFLRYAPRWSPAGHRRVAEFLASFLIERVPGPWNSRYFQQDRPQVLHTPEARSGVQWTSGTR